MSTGVQPSLSTEREPEYEISNARSLPRTQGTYHGNAEEETSNEGTSVWPNTSARRQVNIRDDRGRGDGSETPSLHSRRELPPEHPEQEWNSMHWEREVRG